MAIGRLAVAGVLAWSCTVWCVQAKDLFVDQNHPQARDDNPGTEAQPFRTIPPAVEAVKPGDTIYVKAGVYSDVIRLKGYGRPRHPNRLTAWKEDRVVIGSTLRDLPPADHWEPIPDRCAGPAIFGSSRSDGNSLGHPVLC